MFIFADATTNPTTLGVIAILISTVGTIIGLWFNYKKDKRVAHKDDLASAYERLDKLEAKVAERDKVIDSQAQIIRELRDELAERDRTIESQKSEIAKLRSRVSKLEKKQSEK